MDLGDVRGRTGFIMWQFLRLGTTIPVPHAQGVGPEPGNVFSRRRGFGASREGVRKIGGATERRAVKEKRCLQAAGFQNTWAGHDRVSGFSSSGVI
jgi:hypothetical protein